MAHVCLDEEEVTLNFLPVWLKQNNLQELIDVFQDEDLTLEDLINLQKQAILDDILQELDIKFVLRVKLKSAINKIIQSQPPDVQGISKMHLISKRLMYALEQIRSASKEIGNNIQFAHDLRQTTRKKEMEINNECNIAVKAVEQRRQAIEQRRQRLLKELNEIENRQNYMINEQLSVSKKLQHCIAETQKWIESETKQINGRHVTESEIIENIKQALNDWRKYEKMGIAKIRWFDRKQYKNWDADNISDWIISLNVGYIMYENILRDKLRREEVDGSVLHEVDKTDLDRFGIKSFKHKLEIMKHINQLVKGSDDESTNQMNLCSNDEMKALNDEDVFILIGDLKDAIKISSFHVSCKSDKINGQDMVGVILYSYDHKMDWRLNNVHCKSGYIIVKSFDNIKHIKSNQGQVHGKCYKFVFGQDIDDKVVGAGFAFFKGKWKFNSYTFNVATKYHDNKKSMHEMEQKCILAALGNWKKDIQNTYCTDVFRQ
eukprot:105395_1